MSSSRPGWYLPFGALTATFLLYVFLGLWFTEWMVGDYHARPPNALDSIFSPETIDAIYEDSRLHHALLELTETVAKTTSEYGDAYGLEGLKSFGTDLIEGVARVKAMGMPAKKQKRGLLEDMGTLFGNATGGIGGFLQQGLAGMTSSLFDELSTPAFFLGIGLGMGAETGLNLTNEAEAKAIGTRVAAAMGEEPTGVNLIAQNLGAGLSGQLAPSLGNLSSDVPIGMAAFALAQGIGRGSASGLNLTQETYAPSNDSDLMAIAGNFGLGLAVPITGSLSMQQLFGASSSEQFMAQLPQLAAAAGQGLGEGASKGLGLMKPNMTGGSPFRKRQTSTDPNQMDLSGTVANFTSGLSQSFLQSSDLSKIVSPDSFSFNLDATGMVSFASGAGKGFGEGFALGLNLVPAANVTSPMTGVNGINQTQEQIAEEFVKGLFAAFLQNGGAAVVGNAIAAQAGGFGKGVDMAKAAEGAARGLAEGTINAFSQAGGIQKVLSGDFPMELAMNLPAIPPTAFNDSLNGSAVSFARGLSGEGVLLVAQLMTANKNNSGPPPFKRSVDETGVVPLHKIMRRAEAPGLAIDSQTLQGILQFGTDTITCNGFGGLAALALGVMNSPVAKANAAKKTEDSPPLDNSTLAALPKDPITISSEGNKFTIKIAEGTVTINELELVPFAVLTAIHVVLSTLAFFYFLPIYLVLGAVMRISVMIGHPFDEASNKKWRNIFLMWLFAPTALAGIILGIVGMGKSVHFQTVHGVMGLIVLILFFPTVILSFMRLRTSAPTPPPSAFVGIKPIPALFKGPQWVHATSGILIQLVLALGSFAWIQGFSELRSISLCVVDAILTANTVVGLVNFLFLVQMSAMAVFGLRVYLEQRIDKQEKAMEKEERGVVEYLGTGTGKTDLQRSDTMKTFGFDSEPFAPAATERKTEDLSGREDSKIGWPSNARKFGGENEMPASRTPSPKSPARSSNPFQDSMEQPLPSPRIYNAKLGGFEDDRSPVFPPSRSPAFAPPPRSPAFPLDEENNAYGPGGFRPSSDLDPQSRYVSYAAPMEGKAGLRRLDSFSKPFDRRPSGEELRERYEEMTRERLREEDKFKEREGGYGGFGNGTREEMSGGGGGGGGYGGFGGTYGYGR